MKLYEYQSREEYVGEQIVRSQKKFGFCKVYFGDIIRYRKMIELDSLGQAVTYPILTLGVRSGAEVDIFRAGFFGPLLTLPAIQHRVSRIDTTADAEHKMDLARRYGLGAGSYKDGRVMGVEINPDCQRPDVHVGSFDELPAEWEGKYRILFSNSFDHSMDPEKTVREWKRVAAPGAYVIIGFTPQVTPTSHDPLGGLTFDVMLNLWQAPLVYATETLNRNGYHEICFRL
jgi:hypothetical protein